MCVCVWNIIIYINLFDDSMAVVVIVIAMLVIDLLVLSVVVVEFVVYVLPLLYQNIHLEIYSTHKNG